MPGLFLYAGQVRPEDGVLKSEITSGLSVWFCRLNLRCEINYKM